MGMCKLALDGIRGIEHCSYAVAMARNGIELGVVVAGDPLSWHVAPSPTVPSAVWFAGYGIYICVCVRVCGGRGGGSPDSSRAM